MNKFNLNKAWIIFGACMLAGCSVGKGTDDLEQFVQTTLNRTPGPIEPMPQFAIYEPFTYSAANLRSPFDSPLEALLAEQQNQVVTIAPDDNRPKEFLEGFALSTLSLVGSLSRDNVRWALIQDSDLNVHRVTVGNYLGRNHGRIVRTSETSIDLIEIVPSGNGNWVERPQTLTLENMDL
jgi:type IV pilus assembly protein PilP